MLLDKLIDGSAIHSSFHLDVKFSFKIFFFFTHLEHLVEIEQFTHAKFAVRTRTSLQRCIVLHSVATLGKTAKIVTELLKRKAHFEPGKMMEMYGLSMQCRPDTTRTAMDQNP